MKMGWDMLSKRLLYAVDEEKQTSLIADHYCNGPKFHWITKNIDFEQWKSATGPGPSVLWLSTPVPYDHGTTDMCAHIVNSAKQGASKTVLHFFRSSEPAAKCRLVTTLTHTLLLQLVRNMSKEKADSIAVSFLKVLAGRFFERCDTWDFRVDNSPDDIMNKIMNLPESEIIIEALAQAITEAGIHELFIIVDDVPGNVAFWLAKHMTDVRPEPKVLITSREPPSDGVNIRGMVCIEYNKERLGLYISASFSALYRS